MEMTSATRFHDSHFNEEPTRRRSSPSAVQCSVAVLTRAWADAWSTAATDSEVLDSMSSKTSSMFS